MFIDSTLTSALFTLAGRGPTDRDSMQEGHHLKLEPLPRRLPSALVSTQSERISDQRRTQQTELCSTFTAHLVVLAHVLVTVGFPATIVLDFPKAWHASFCRLINGATFGYTTPM
jgi:hypothetical protein